MFAICTLTYLPLALVSFLVVDDVIVKGLFVDDVSVCDGNLFTDKVTFALPFKFLKSGINLLTDTNFSPGPPCEKFVDHNHMILCLM